MTVRDLLAAVMFNTQGYWHELLKQEAQVSPEVTSYPYHHYHGGETWTVAHKDYLPDWTGTPFVSYPTHPGEGLQCELSHLP